MTEKHIRNQSMKGHQMIMGSCIILLSFLLMGCGGARQAKQLSDHQSMLKRVASSTMDPEAKLDSLAMSFIGMMNEGLRIVNPKKGAQYIGKYSKTNEPSIDNILAEIGAWQKEMSTLEKIGLGVSLVGKPYAGDLVSLVRKFERKYQQYKFVLGLTKKVKSGLINAGLKTLGL